MEVTEAYELIDDIVKNLLSSPTYKTVDKWVARRVRNALKELADEKSFEHFDNDMLTIYIVSFLTGYAARMDEDYNSDDTMADPALANTKLLERIMAVIQGYKPYIQARAIHFLVENYPGQEDFDDPIFEGIAIYTVFGFLSGFTYARSGDADIEVKEKMSAKGLNEKQCQNAANAACANLPVPKTTAVNLAKRIKDISDKELYPRSGVRKGFPVSTPPVDILRLYSTGYAAGSIHARDVRDGKVALSTNKFKLQPYMQIASRLWTTWCYRQQHTTEVRRAARFGWNFYLNKNTNAIITELEDVDGLDEKSEKALVRITNNVFAYEFMRGWVDGFSDSYYTQKPLSAGE